MKYAKMIGLAALAVLALMAVVAASASANAKVCSTEGTGTACKAGHGKVYKGAVSSHLTAGKSAILESGFIKVTCTESSAGGEITNGETGTGKITSLTFGSCSSGLGACTAKTTASAGNPWPATVTTDTPGVENTNGLMDVSNVTGEFTCAGVTCKYISNSASATVDGSDTNPEITASKVALTREEGSSGLCSATATWSGEYQITTPKTLFVE
jgi:hypothetical protein